MGILELPSGSAILSWPAANYNDPVTRGWAPSILTLLLTVGCLLVFGARMATRSMSKVFGADDWIMCAAMVPILGLVVNMFLALRVYHFDRHLWDINSDYSAMLKVTFAEEFLYNVASSLVRVSILTYLLRFTKLSSPAFKYAIYGLVALVLCHLTAFTAQSFISCIPFESSFTVNMVHNTTDAARTCASGDTVASVRNGLFVAQDFCITVLATMLSWNLNMNKAQRWAVSAVLGLAFLVCFVGVVRLGYFWRIYAANSDWSWYGGIAFMWSTVECLLGMLCGSLPALRVHHTIAPSLAGQATSPIDDVLRKFSMNESGLNKKQMAMNGRAMESNETLVGTGANRNNNSYGSRRRSTVANLKTHMANGRQD